MAQTIFKSWFVDFEPVKAKEHIRKLDGGSDQIEKAAQAIISGAVNLEDILKSSNLTDIDGTINSGLDEKFGSIAKEQQKKLHKTAKLFPDKFVESSLGLIPKGWGVKNVKEVVDTISKTYPLKSVDEAIFLNTGDIQDGKFLHREKSKTSVLPGQAKKSIKKDDILYSEIRPKNKRYAYVFFDAEEYVVSTKLMVLRSKNNFSSLFAYFVLTQQSTIDYLQRLAESRSGTFPQITFDVLSAVEFIIPNDIDNLLVRAFEKLFLKPYLNSFVNNENEIGNLMKIRDAILPKLLSGELMVSNGS